MESRTSSHRYLLRLIIKGNHVDAHTCRRYSDLRRALRSALTFFSLLITTVRVIKRMVMQGHLTTSGILKGKRTDLLAHMKIGTKRWIE